jgi:methionyl-tRNA formyltransferase
MNKKVYIASSREIGKKCKEWAVNNLPVGFTITDTKDECDIFISVLYDKLIPANFIKRKRCFNFHPGILPQYRGASVYSWSIINGEDKTGITLHKIDDGIDSGDIIEIRAFPIDKLTDTAQTLFERGNKIMFMMFKNWFELLLKDDYVAIKQDETKAGIYYRKDLEKIKDLTKYVRALTFDNKESAYYINNSGDKVYIEFKK